MPIVHVTVTKKLTAEVKADFMEFVAQQICANTSTLPKNIYVYMHEMERENVRKLAPTVLIDWTMMPDRTAPVKKVIMKAIHERLAEIEPERAGQQLCRGRGRPVGPGQQARCAVAGAGGVRESVQRLHQRRQRRPLRRLRSRIERWRESDADR